MTWDYTGPLQPLRLLSVFFFLSALLLYFLGEWIGAVCLVELELYQLIFSRAG